MKIYINQPKINLRARLANFASVGGLVILLASVVLPLFLPAWANITYILMIAGMGMAMIGIYFANRWVRKPRPEESLAKALKSFDDKYCLYHYPSLPCDHLLLTPTGVVLFEVINLAGHFSYKNGKWKEAMTIGRALRYIVEERVGNPILSARQAAQALGELIFHDYDTDCSDFIQPAVVFTHPLAQLSIENPPILVCKIEKLKKQLHAKAPRLAPDLYEKLCVLFESKTTGE
jgi:hypothetical protein